MNPLNNLPSAVSGAIPARAGFTSWPRAPRSGPTDHPRSRGVYCYHARVRVHVRGSSPLARGLPRKRHHDKQTPGIIPARAGFTAVDVIGAGAARDHPRSRGVYPVAAGAPAACAGSSPLARGLHRVRRPLDEERGIIPARAGFTRANIWAY